jgi:GAF domain-containing protein
MALEEFCSLLEGRLAATAVSAERLEIAAREIGSLFGVESHEVGLFRVDTARNQIYFRWPPSMTAASRIPLKAFNSLVAKTATERRSFIDNEFAATRHLYMLEHLLVDKTERIAVQKVMSVPIVAGENVLGVIQVVRKGSTPQEAGADFTRAELDDLEKVAGTLGGYEL